MPMKKKVDDKEREGLNTIDNTPTLNVVHFEGKV